LIAIWFTAILFRNFTYSESERFSHEFSTTVRH
jgi:hypothetical protein